MNALPISIVVSATTSFSLGLTFLYLWWAVLRRRYVLLLGVGRLLLVPFVVLIAFNAKHPSMPLAVGTAFFASFSLVAWVAGIYDFVYRHLRVVPLLLLAVAMIAWQVVGPLIASGDTARELPDSLTRAAVFLWTAWLIYRGPRATGRRLLAALVALNGIHALDYPYLARMDIGIPLGLTISTFLAITLSMVLLVLLLDEARAATAVAERERSVAELRAGAAERERHERQRVRQEALLRLTSREALFAGELDAAWRAITETAAGTLGTERASVWLTLGQETGLRCADLYERPAGRHTAGTEMSYSLAPSYFRSLQGGRAVTVADALRDPRAAELRSPYLEPLGIRAMLDAPIRARGTTVGIVSLESTAARDWSAEDEGFAASLADLSVLVMEVHARRQTSDALRESELRYRAAFQQAAVGLAEVAPGGEILRANHRLCELVGYEEPELLRIRFPDLVHPDDVQPELEFLRRPDAHGEAFYRQPRFLRKDGTVGWAAVSTASVRDGDGVTKFFLSVFEDVTERVNLESQLAQAQKQEALGRLAGGVAHDFNNILSAVLGYTDLLRQTFPAQDARHQDLDEIQRAGERAAGLVRQLLAFARRQPVEPRVVRPDEIVRNLEPMLRRLIGADVAMRLHAEGEVSPVRVDPGRFEQVILNLVVNAREAMPDGGELTIEVGDVWLGEEYVRLHRESRVGRHAMVAVTDTGAGMSPQVLERIFEPFFSTKPAGKGTGLGLATAYGIVRQAGGNIWVYSEPGHGTTFKIYLPVAEAVPEVLAMITPREEPARGTETVLLVEDEDAVRAMVARVLAASGYTVLEAADGQQALALAGGHHGPIHLLVTDVVMPRMGGAELARRLAAVRPDLKIIFISGYTEDGAARLAGIGRGSVYLSKPFSVASLARRVRALLDGSA